MKVVWKYGTGQAVPEGAVYLYSREETLEGQKYVWHYFLVEEDGV